MTSFKLSYGLSELYNPSYAPSWTIAEELDFSMGFHQGSNAGMPTLGSTASRTVQRVT
jgi:hypothetical protein